MGFIGAILSVFAVVGASVHALPAPTPSSSVLLAASPIIVTEYQTVPAEDSTKGQLQYIQLYNTSESLQQLNNWRLNNYDVDATSVFEYIFEDAWIAPHSYIAFFAPQDAVEGRHVERLQAV